MTPIATHQIPQQITLEIALYSPTAKEEFRLDLTKSGMDACEGETDKDMKCRIVAQRIFTSGTEDQKKAMFIHLMQFRSNPNAPVAPGANKYIQDKYDRLVDDLNEHGVFQGITLNGPNFTIESKQKYRLNLSNLDLRGARLRNLVIIYTDLTNTNLAFVDLTGTTISNSDLTNASLMNAGLEGITFNYTSLNNIFIAGAKITKDTMFYYSDLSIQLPPAALKYPLDSHCESYLINTIKTIQEIHPRHDELRLSQIEMICDAILKIGDFPVVLHTILESVCMEKTYTNHPRIAQYFEEYSKVRHNSQPDNPPGTIN